MRQYAGEQLRTAGEDEPLRRRHAAWCVELAEAAEPHLLSAEQVTWLLRLTGEDDNIRAALAWCLVHDPPLGLRLAASLWQFWRIRLQLSEGRRWLERLLARTPEPTVVRARALAAAATLAHWQLDVEATTALLAAALDLAQALGQHALTGRILRERGYLTWARFGDHAGAWAHFEEGLALSRAAGDRHGVATNLMQQGRMAAAEGDYRQAQPLLDQSVALISEVGDRWQRVIALEETGGVALIVGDDARAEALFQEALATAEALEAAGFGDIHRKYHLGTVALWRGDAETAIRWYEALLALTRANEHTAGIADNLAGLGHAVLVLGGVARATALFQESLSLARERADRSGIGRALHGLGLAAMHASDPVGATERLRESLRLRRAMDERLGIAECLEALAAVGVQAATGRAAAERALRWLGAAQALRARLGAPLPPVDRPRYRATLAAAGAWLDDAEATLDAGQSLSLADAIADALGEPPARQDTVAGEVGRHPGPTAQANGTPTPPVKHGELAALSARELDVLRLIVAGHTNQQIADALALSINTVRHHVTHILDKTGCQNRASVTAFALRHGLQNPADPG
jgi:DNA-binding CsgD family transcriptional regulator/tetratricopeptide (TPR) repeat protein